MIKNLKNKKKKGFTLIELIIVIAILAILAAVAIPQFGKVRSNATVSADISNAKVIQGAVTQLIAEEKIDLSDAGKKEFILDGINTDGGNNEDAVIKQLQKSAPKIKTTGKGSYFKVVIDSDENVTIYTTASTPEIVYPNPATGSVYYK